MKMAEWIKKRKKGLPIVLFCAFIAAACVMITMTGITSDKEESAAYQGTKPEKDNQTADFTESGNVSVGTSTQKLKLDISAYSQQDSTFSWAAEGHGMMLGMTQEDSTQAEEDDDDRTLEVEAVYITSGQEVTKGEPLYKLTEESVENIRNELVKDVDDAELALKQTETEKKKTDLAAAQEYEVNITYGEAADIEYQDSIEAAEQSYTEAQEKLAKAEEELQTLSDEKTVLEAKLKEEETLYQETAYRAGYIDKEDDPYGYISTWNLSREALAAAEDTEEQKEDKEEEIAEKQSEMQTLSQELTKAEKEQKISTAAAEATLENRQNSYESAAELCSVKKALGEADRSDANYEYENAKTKLAEFDACISDNNLLSEYDGVITSVFAGKGDILTKGAELIAVKDNAQIELTVSVNENDVEQIQVGDTVSIKLAAFPDRIDTGEVVTIGEAQADSYSGTISYEVTVSLNEEADKVYEGMSGEVTFQAGEGRGKNG